MTELEAVQYLESLREQGQWFKLETEPKLPGRIMVDVATEHFKHRSNQGSFTEAVEWIRMCHGRHGLYHPGG